MRRPWNSRMYGRSAKKYAILSHRWEDGEVSFQAMQDRTTSSKLAGYWKILQTCKQAQGDGLGWVWVDACCINKKSSAELTEAINSMYRSYSCRSAVLCLSLRYSHGRRSHEKRLVHPMVDSTGVTGTSPRQLPMTAHGMRWEANAA